MLRLKNRHDMRADEVLSQQHAEHRRFGWVFKGRLRQMDAGVPGAGRDQEAAVSSVRAQGEEQHIPLRLLHLVDAAARDLLLELGCKRGGTDGVKRHAQSSMMAAKSVFRRSRRPSRYR